FRAEDFDNPPPGYPLATQGDVQTQGPSRNALDVHYGAVSQLHDGTLAELLLDLLEGALQFLVITLVRHKSSSAESKSQIPTGTWSFTSTVQIYKYGRRQSSAKFRIFFRENPFVRL